MMKTHGTANARTARYRIQLSYVQNVQKPKKKAEKVNVLPTDQPTDRPTDPPTQ